MQLDPKTLELIQKTAQRAQAARVLPELSGDGRKAYVQQGDAIKVFDLAPPNRRHLVYSLDDLIRYALRPENPKPVVWHSPNSVTLLPDDDDQRDSVVFMLYHSERYACLESLASEPKTLSQQQFVRVLRRDLGLEAVIVQQFRCLDWKNVTSGTSEINQQNVKVGKSVLAEVAGLKDLPEEITVPTPVYSQTGENREYLVQCYVDIDPVNQVFGFGPLPDELVWIVDLAQADIRGRLEAGLAASGDRAAVPIYYGEP